MAYWFKEKILGITHMAGLAKMSSSLGCFECRNLLLEIRNLGIVSNRGIIINRRGISKVKILDDTIVALGN
jgi:hypothetical protein